MEFFDFGRCVWAVVTVNLREMCTARLHVASRRELKWNSNMETEVNTLNNSNLLMSLTNNLCLTSMTSCSGSVYIFLNFILSLLGFLIRLPNLLAVHHPRSQDSTLPNLKTKLRCRTWNKMCAWTESNNSNKDLKEMF